MPGVIVTGAASGIGYACATTLLGEGRAVSLWDRDPSVEGKAAALGAPAFCLDVTDPQTVAKAIDQAVTDLGGIDGLVHAAGVVSVDPLGKITSDLWDRVLDVNLKAFAFIAQAIWPHLKQQPGAALVGISSIEGIQGNGAIPAYCASKAGMLGLARSMAQQLATDGIRVNCVCPGYIETPMLAEALDIPGVREHFAKSAPLGRLGQPQDIANAVAFLLSDKASFITGTGVVVDGGVIAVNQ